MRQLKTLIPIIILTLIGCDFSDNKLIIENKSDNSIAFIIPAEPNYFPTSNDSKKKFNKKRNDSLLNIYAKFDPNEESFGGVHFLAKKSKKNILTFNIKWEQIVESTPTKSLKILFFSKKIMPSGNYKWNEIYDRNLFKEKIFTLKELENLNWIIKYND